MSHNDNEFCPRCAELARHLLVEAFLEDAANLSKFVSIFFAGACWAAPTSGFVLCIIIWAVAFVAWHVSRALQHRRQRVIRHLAETSTCRRMRVAALRPTPIASGNSGP